MRRLQNRMAGRLAMTLFVVGACCRLCSAESKEVERQTREFQVSVDGTDRGTCTMRISRCDDGTETVRVDATIRVNLIVYRYTYVCAGTEVWKNDRLVELENTADYNGTRYVVRASPAEKGLRVTVNGKTSHAAHEAWTTSYWRLPERFIAEAEPPDAVIPAGGTQSAPANPGPQSVTLLDSDHGRAMRGQLQRVGEEILVVGGKRLKCTHYRLRGDVQVDLWYDADRRLVRQHSLEDGHKTRLMLLRVDAE